MEKYNDAEPLSQSDAENTAFLNAHFQKQEVQRRQTYVYLTLFNLFIFMLSMLSLICSVMSQKDSSGHSTAKLMDQFGLFSPAMHAVEYEHQKFSFPPPLTTTKYVGITEEVDDAWMDLAYMPDQMVSLADFPRLQMPADSLQVTDPATGETGYRVGLEVFHQLHCLNLLRMSTHADHYRNVSWSDMSEDPTKVRIHLDHCIEVLRLNLMCTADVNVFTFHEKPGKEGYWPEYESHHVCRNFDLVREWAFENALPDADV